MAASITITNSPIQKVAGIPVSVVISTNIPATVFYTLDGSTPTVASTVYIDPIVLPTNSGQVTLSLISYDGIELSPVITELYGVNHNGLNHSLAITTFVDNINNKTPFPYSSSPFMDLPYAVYGGTGLDAVNDPSEIQIPDGYDGTATGTPSNYTNKPLTDYQLIYSETNYLGQYGKGIGTVPATVTPVVDTYNSPPQYSETNSPTFNPKARFIYQDGTKEPYDSEHPVVMRPFFSLERPDKIRDGAMMTTSDVQPPTGSVLVPRYNPADNTMNYYYFDSRSCRWIISKEPYVQHKDPNPLGLQHMVFDRGAGPWKVYRWILFKNRVLS